MDYKNNDFDDMFNQLNSKPRERKDSEDTAPINFNNNAYLENANQHKEKEKLNELFGSDDENESSRVGKKRSDNNFNLFENSNNQQNNQIQNNNHNKNPFEHDADPFNFHDINKPDYNNDVNHMDNINLAFSNNLNPQNIPSDLHRNKENNNEKSSALVVNNSLCLDFNEISYLNNVVKNNDFEPKKEIKPKNQPLIEDVSHLRASIDNNPRQMNNNLGVNYNNINNNVSHNFQNFDAGLYSSKDNVNDMISMYNMSQQNQVSNDKYYNSKNGNIQNNRSNREVNITSDNTQNYYNQIKSNIQRPEVAFIPNNEIEIGVFNRYAKNQKSILLKESIFYNKYQFAMQNKYSSISRIDTLVKYVGKNLPSVYLGELDPESLALENIVISDEIKTKNSAFFLSDLNLIKNMSFEELPNSVIGPIKPCNLSGGYCFYRETSTDGDSFFRAFIFKYIENCIFSSDTNKLNKIYYNIISRYLRSSPGLIQYKTDKKGVNMVDCFNEVIIFFSNLLELISQGDANTTYDYFVKSFALKNKLSLALIAYCRFVIIDFIQINENIFQGFDMYHPISDEADIKPIIYLSDAGYNYRDYLKEISYFHTEISPFLMVILSFAFDTKIEILSIFEGAEQDKYTINPVIGNFIEDRTNTFPVVTIIENNQYISTENTPLLASLGFLIAYNNSLVEFRVNPKILGFNSLNMNSGGDFVKLNFSNSTVCFKCNKPNGKLFSKNPDYLNLAVCEKCCASVVKKAITKRLKSLNEEKFTFQECK